MGDLTNNFSLWEFCISKYVDEPLEPSRFQQDCLKLMCEALMQPIRNEFGRIDITHGVSNEKLNSLLREKGYEVAADTDHNYGAACDFSSHIVVLRSIYSWIIENKLPYRQLIYYPKMNIIHIAINYPGKTYKNQYWIKE